MPPETRRRSVRLEPDREARSAGAPAPSPRGARADAADVPTTGTASQGNTSLTLALAGQIGTPATMLTIQRRAALSLQRTAGNRAVARALTADYSPTSDQAMSAARSSALRTVDLSLNGTEHPLRAEMERTDVRFRVPTFADLKAVYEDTTLKIPEDVIKSRVGQLLGRMEREKRLKTKDDVPTIIGKIFPSPGTIDEAEFNNAIDVSDRTKIYQSVLDAETTVKAADKPKLKTAMTDAVDLVKKVEADATGLTEVFGSQASAAKGHYGDARKALEDVASDMDKGVTTDYNLDDPEVGLGGWANFASKHMHLLVEVVKVADAAETCTTLIHEASHLAHPSIDDHGYYGTANFEALPESIKVANAGHYEELPRRLLGTSSYAGVTFKPGVLKGGGKVTWEDGIRRMASEFIRKAWDAAVDTHSFIRDVRKAALGGDATPFTVNKALILEISKLMDLTIHTQDPANAQVTPLDVTITESIARGVSLVGDLAVSIPATKPKGSFASTGSRNRAARRLIVEAAVAKYGRLLGTPARDKKLLRWLVFHYRSLPGV